MPLSDAPGWLVVPGSDCDPSEIGTKALNLALLESLGFEVPPCRFIATLHSDRARFDSKARYLEAIDDFSARLADFLPSAHGWAVRSSATIEDLPDESHAGRFETVFISDAAELADAVNAVWSSAGKAGIGPESMGVVIQVLVDADFAGVAFSRDPTRSGQSMVIEAVPGIAARFVDGEVTPWRIRCGEADLELPEGMNPDCVVELKDGVARLAEQLGTAVDVEWAISDGKVHWLQVRPLTGASISEFTVPDSLKAELKGLWVRINHSFSPQAPLVATMNPGGYFDGPGWSSRLVNHYHYIQEHKRAAETLSPDHFDDVLDEWDQWEGEFERRFETRNAADLRELALADLWNETTLRIELSRDYFEHYSDRRFLEIRDRCEQRVDELVRKAMGHGLESGNLAGELLSRLGSQTEVKQRQLAGLARLRAANPDADIRDKPEWREFIDAFGYESPTTHLFYLPTLEENPGLLFAMIDAMSDSGSDAHDAADWQAAARRILDKLPESERGQFTDYLSRWRRCLLRTENDDYALARCTMLVRYAYLEAGRRLVDSDCIDAADDVFFLTGTELQGFLTGTDEDIDPAEVSARKREFRESKLLSPPPMIVNGRPMTPAAKVTHMRLTGTPASPGVANGTVVVLNDPFSCVGRQLPRDCVVVAPVVTPSLAYSLMGCAAVVTEIGGLASHGAIVAREMAIPAVVGVSNALTRLRTGMSVAVDGGTGEIEITGQSQ